MANKLKILNVVPEVFIGMLQQSDEPFAITVTKNPLPKDTTIERVLMSGEVDFPNNIIKLVIRSEEFEDVPEGSIPPEYPDIGLSRTLVI